MKHLFLLLFGMVTMVAHAQVPEYMPTEGLVAYYPFNGNANDESGNGHDGIVNGASLTIDELGNASSAYYFNGGSRIDIPNHPDFEFEEMTFAITYQNSPNGNAIPNGNSILVAKQPAEGWGSGWGFGDGTDDVEFSRCMTTTSGNECLEFGEQQYQTWRTVVYTHACDLVKVYIDGTLVYEEVTSGGFIPNTLPVTIGMRGNGWHQFIGSISMISFWDRALCAVELAALTSEVPLPNDWTGSEQGYDCDGNCLCDADDDGVCDEFEVLGCDDPTSCNYSALATEDDGSCLGEISVEAGPDITICEGDSVTLNYTVVGGDYWGWENAPNNSPFIPGVTWNGSPDSSSYYVVFAAFSNSLCFTSDSLFLEIVPASSSLDSQVACESFTWLDGITYTESTNEPSITYTNDAGCDSIVTLDLTINYSSYTQIDTTVVNGIEYNGATLSTEGEHIFYFENAMGCDSIVSLNLTFGNLDLDETSTKETQAKVFPNPGSNQITIIGNEQGISEQIDVINILGRLIWTGQFNGTITLDVARWPRGMYFIDVYGAGNQRRMPVILN